MMNRRTAIAAASAFLMGHARASEWPDKPFKLIVPFPAGGGVDTAGRVFTVALTDLLKQSAIIDNRPGASGAIGAQAVAKAAPDGTTFLLASPAEVLVSAIAGQALPYDPRTDLVPVALAGETPLAIVAHPSVLPQGGLKELIALAKSGKRKLSYGTPGNGSTMHFAGEALKASTGLDWMHVPYKGAAPAVNDVLGGQIECVISGLPPLVPHIKSGRLKALAVTSAKRSAALPDVMAVAELPGLSDFRFTNWMGVYAPRNTPPEIVAELGKAFEAAAKDPVVMKRLQEAGLDARGIRGTEFEAFLASERTRYETVARGTKISLN